MSYRAAPGLGASRDWSDVGSSGSYQSFWGWRWSASEVYAYRFYVTGLPATVESVSQVYPLVKAYLRGMATGDRNQDIRGIALMPSGSGYVAEIVITDAGGMHIGGNTEVEVEQAMNQELASSGSSLRVSKGAMTVLSDSKKASYAHWFSQPAIWSFKTFDTVGAGNLDGGFTRAYLDGRGVWLNSSAANPQYELAPRKQAEIASPGEGGLVSGGAGQGAPGSAVWYLGAAALAALAGIVYVGKRRRERG